MAESEEKKYYAICEGCKSLKETLSKEQIEEKVLEKNSTEEILEGTWINGKPLYKKIIEFTIPTSPNDGAEIWSSAESNIVANDVEEGYIESAFFISDTNRCPLPYIATGGNVKINVMINKFDKKLNLNVANGKASFSGLKGYAIVKYTKLTD